MSSLHYGGSQRAANSSTPGLSPAPARTPGRPSQNTSFAAQKRFEMISRMENAAIPEGAIAPMLGISVARLRYLKKLPEYLIVRMRVTHGIILDHDQKVAEIRSQRKEILVNLLPAALQAVANTLLTQANTYADRKLQLDVAKDVLDRSDYFAKVSRTELKPVSFFDFEKSDQESANVMKTLKAVGRAPELDAAALKDIQASNTEFSAGSKNLCAEDQQAALDDLEAGIE